MTEKVMGPDKGCSNIVQHVVYTVALFRGGGGDTTAISPYTEESMGKLYIYNHVRNYPCLETGAGVTVRE